MPQVRQRVDALLLDVGAGRVLLAVHEVDRGGVRVDPLQLRFGYRRAERGQVEGCPTVEQQPRVHDTRRDARGHRVLRQPALRDDVVVDPLSEDRSDLQILLVGDHALQTYGDLILRGSKERYEVYRDLRIIGYPLFR
ncbi:hypothetical protein [Lentzea terrae]|uniref:hypothetical protein n=1 Tax=Lentzea terrae TaxID=2200761 RepID=UPI00130032DF|nr:hypothetical protein [Lentzea terrae]